MPRANPDTVLALVDAAFEGMDPYISSASADEVVSACLSISLRAVKAAVVMKADKTALRSAVYAVLAELNEGLVN